MVSQPTWWLSQPHMLLIVWWTSVSLGLTVQHFKRPFFVIFWCKIYFMFILNLSFMIIWILFYPFILMFILCNFFLVKIKIKIITIVEIIKKCKIYNMVKRREKKGEILGPSNLDHCLWDDQQFDTNFYHFVTLSTIIPLPLAISNGMATNVHIPLILIALEIGEGWKWTIIDRETNKSK